ncbi:MAG: hypothetical protein M3Q30_25385 [Actinomycetota bacterium]|nr:hypothetical protein [Actinomycetota bacterium]
MDEAPEREVGVREIVVDEPGVREIVVVEVGEDEVGMDEVDVDFVRAVVVVGVVGRTDVVGAVVAGDGVGTAL